MPHSLPQLITHLKQGCAPFYLISGDETLLVEEARDHIFSAAKKYGFSEKETYHIEPGFDFTAFLQSFYNDSLFSEKRIIDIRNSNAKIDAAFSEFLSALLKQPNPDRLVVMSTLQLSSAQQKSSWFELIHQKGIYVPIWKIKPNALPTWITERAKSSGIMLSVELAQLLAHFTQGNLLSSHQTLQKLVTQYPNTNITKDQLMSVLSDHARFGIFDLSDALDSRNPKKIVRVLNRLAQLGEEPTLVLWVICRKLRENSNLEKNKRALQKAAAVDEIIKGGRIGNVWDALLELCL